MSPPGRQPPLDEIAECAGSDALIRSIGGYVSQKVLECYWHVRLEVNRRALEALIATRPENEKLRVAEEDYVTRNVTKGISEEVPAPQVFQNVGGDDGTRTRGLMRDRHAF